MRKGRLTVKRKKQIGALIVLQMFAIYYLFLFSISVLQVISPTSAYFSDQETKTLTLVGGADWDRSSLKFTGVTEVDESGYIFAEIMNVGDRDMEGTSEYWVYYDESKNPKKQENPMFNAGTIPKLKTGEKTNLILPLTEENLLEGNYKFRAFQRPGHAFKEERQDLWSDTISYLIVTDPAQEDNASDDGSPNEDVNSPAAEDKKKDDPHNKEKATKPAEDKDSQQPEEEDSKPADQDDSGDPSQEENAENEAQPNPADESNEPETPEVNNEENNPTEENNQIEENGEKQGEGTIEDAQVAK